MLEYGHMYEAIKKFNEQFSYQPEINNIENLKRGNGFVVVGMGGSALAPILVQIFKPEIDLLIHKDYGLPVKPIEVLKNKLIILSSYSGNTEETIEAFNQAKEKNLNMAVIAVGGKLLSLAVENSIPYIKLPDTGIQPRSALGYSIKAFMKFMNLEDGLGDISKLKEELKPDIYEEIGKDLANDLKNYIPIIYTSNKNSAIGYNWKIKLNETGKIPSFCNVLPELNHNEMTSFDPNDKSYLLSKNFYFILIKDEKDNPKVINRMEVLEKLYKDRNFKVRVLDIKGENIWLKIFSSLLIADFCAYYIADIYGLESEKVPMVEEFKKLIT